MKALWGRGSGARGERSADSVLLPFRMRRALASLQPFWDCYFFNCLSKIALPTSHQKPLICQELFFTTCPPLAHHQGWWHTCRIQELPSLNLVILNRAARTFSLTLSLEEYVCCELRKSICRMSKLIDSFLVFICFALTQRKEVDGGGKLPKEVGEGGCERQ